MHECIEQKLYRNAKLQTQVLLRCQRLYSINDIILIVKTRLRNYDMNCNTVCRCVCMYVCMYFTCTFCQLCTVQTSGAHAIFFLSQPLSQQLSQALSQSLIQPPRQRDRSTFCQLFTVQTSGAPAIFVFSVNNLASSPIKHSVGD